MWRMSCVWRGGAGGKIPPGTSDYQSQDAPPLQAHRPSALGLTDAEQQARTPAGTVTEAALYVDSSGHAGLQGGLESREGEAPEEQKKDPASLGECAEKGHVSQATVSAW